MEFPILAILVTNVLLMLSTQRISLISLVACQGLCLSIHVALAEVPILTIVFIFFIHGLMFPTLLHLASTGSNALRRKDPQTHHRYAILFAMLSLVVADAVSRQFALGLFGTSFVSTLLTGGMLLATGRTWVSQMTGYLVFENGILALILGLLGAIPLLLECVEAVVVLGFTAVIAVAIRNMAGTLYDQSLDALDTLRE